jgi:hypothetical protein
MTIAEILLQDYDTEMQGIRTTLERIPEDNPEFKCHDKSMPMGRLAVHVSTLPFPVSPPISLPLTSSTSPLTNGPT